VHEVKGDGVLGFSTFFEIPFVSLVKRRIPMPIVRFYALSGAPNFRLNQCHTARKIISPLNSDYFIDSGFLVRY
jgi:hypothetical protein